MSVCINPNCPRPQNTDTLLFCQRCGSELLLEDRYRVTKRLGGGGFSVTYEVRDCVPSKLGELKMELKVLKVLNDNHPKYVELFQREASFLANLRHPGIPHVESDGYFTFQPANSRIPLHCLVMEKIEGLNLFEYANRKGGAIKQKRALQWLIQIVKILQEVHQRKFFHRDIKPSNIMLRSDGQLVLIDFGTVRQMTGTFMAKHPRGQVTGIVSTGYTPPEQMNGQAVPQSDFFALGRSFVYLLTGQEPSELYDSSAENLRWRGVTSQLDKPFADLLDRLMARRPQDRPQSADDVLAELTQLYQTLYPTGESSPNRPADMAPTLPPTEVFKQTEQIATGGAPVTLRLPLDEAFFSRCQQELALVIGPMASIICQRTRDKNPTQSRGDFMATLCQKIPNPKQAEEFQRRLL